MVDQGKSSKRQEVHLLNRRLLEVSGVLNVDSFDSEEFLLETELGYFNVKGQNLHIKNLNLEQGFVAIEGTISSLNYLDGAGPDKSKGFLGKLFK
jgi:sporulation protein YabP